jgi:REP element-mobilizing transposase RayT
MARQLRLEYEGAYYHVMARGNRRQAIFRDDLDRRFWLKALGEVCGRTGWRVHAWVLMGNHFHLFLETPSPNLVEGMKWLQNAYTRRFNTRHKEWGRLFGDRYKAIPVEGRTGDFYGALCDYIHLNPVRAGLVRREAGRGLRIPLEQPGERLCPAGEAPRRLAGGGGRSGSLRLSRYLGRAAALSRAAGSARP